MFYTFSSTQDYHKRKSIRENNFTNLKATKPKKQILAMLNAVLVLLFAIAVSIASVSLLPTRFNPPDHLLNHPLVDRPNFLSEETINDLLQMTRDIGVIPSVMRDTDSYKVKRTHIGEAMPFDEATGSCPEPLLIPDESRKLCVFPGRIDVGKHFIMTGGIEGMKESHQKLSSRVQPFIKYIFNYSEHPVPKKLFESPEFMQLAKSVCPADKQGVLDYFQFNLVIQVPGQTVATHIDAPVFYHANRFEFPQWLLASMVFSGLFQDDFVHQVQVVAYYHKWKTADGGSFWFWNHKNGTAETAFPASGSANSVDGSKMMHAAAIYRPKEDPPILPQTAVNALQFQKETGKWCVTSDGNVVRCYEESDIRFGAVYRARCFADEKDFEYFKKSQQEQFTLEHVLNVFEKDLRAKGVYREGLNHYQLGNLIMETYVKYPLSPTAIIPYNYCALAKLYPWTKHILQYFCKF